MATPFSFDQNSNLHRRTSKILKMPVDHKRINGPENTIPYKLYTKLNVKTFKEALQDAVKNGVRNDKRKLDEHRRICKQAIETPSHSYY